MPGKNVKLDANNKIKFDLVSTFYGYTNRIDQTKLKPGYLVKGSQNVLIDVSGRVKTRLGYTLDGAANTTSSGVLTAFDWEEHDGGTINLRQWDTNLEYRYVASDGTVTWITLYDGMDNIGRFTNFWNDTEKENVVLFVKGTNAVFEWNGAITTLKSSTSNTLTKDGTATWGETGFYAIANKKVVINGTEYTYTAGEGTTTLTGVSPNPTGEADGSVIHQQYFATTGASLVGIPTTYLIDLISMLDNQIYYGSESSNVVYISKVNDYDDCGYTSPTRLVNEGALMTLRATLKAFVPQESYMYMTAGKSQWYKTNKQLSSDNKAENFTVEPLKTGSNQAAISQEAITKDKNNVVFISNESILSTLGRVENQLATPMTEDLSWLIVNDMNNYDFTGAFVKYFKNFIYVALPADSKTIIYNQTDPTNPFWEAPQIFPFSCFSVIDNNIYGHSFSQPETYKMFDGVDDNGQPIKSNATFSYMNIGVRELTKYFNEFYTEGYINNETTLTNGWKYEMDSFETDIKKYIKGNDTVIVGIVPNSSSLGKESLGKNPIGGVLNLSTTDAPKFRVIKTTTRKEFYEFQPYYESEGVNQHWELIAFGPLATFSTFGNNRIKQ